MSKKPEKDIYMDDMKNHFFSKVEEAAAKFMDSVDLYETSYGRVWLVQDLLQEAINFYPKNQISIYALINRILLLFQEPVAISAFRKIDGSDGDASYENIFFSFRDKGYAEDIEEHIGEIRRELSSAKNGRVSDVAVWVENSNIYLCLTKVEVDPNSRNGEHEYKFKLLDYPNKNFLLLRKLIFRLSINAKHGGVLGRIADMLRRSSMAWGEGGLPRDDDFFPDEGAVPGMLDGFYEAVDDAYYDVHDTPLVCKSCSGDKGDAIPNMFFAVRTAQSELRYNDKFNYTIRFFFPKTQHDQMMSFWENRIKNCGQLGDDGRSCKYDPDGCFLVDIKSDIPDGSSADVAQAAMVVMGHPFGKWARSITDTIFATGFIDFSAEYAASGRGDIITEGVDPDEIRGDRLRFRAFSCVFNHISKGKKKSLFSVPIRVAETPWVAVVTVTEIGVDDKGRMHGKLSGKNWSPEFNY